MNQMEKEVRAEWERNHIPVVLPETSIEIKDETIEALLLLGGWVFEFEFGDKKSLIFHYEKDYDLYHVEDNLMLSTILTLKVLVLNPSFNTTKHDLISEVILGNRINFAYFNERFAKCGVRCKKVYYKKKNAFKVQREVI